MLSSELSVPVVLHRIIVAACELTSARYGALGVLGPDGTLSDFITHGLSEAGRRRIGALPLGRGILGILLKDAGPLRLAHISHDPRSVGFPPHHPPMTSFLGAPVVARGQVFGNIYLTDKRGASEFSPEDEYALRVLASQAGVAIANATLYEAALARERWLAATHAITSATIDGTPLQQVLSLVASRARELLGGERALIAVPTGESGGSQLRIEAAAGRGTGRLCGRPLKPPGGPGEEAMLTGHPVVVAAAPRLRRGAVPRGPLAHTGPMVFVRLGGRDQSFGVLAVIGSPGQPLPQAEAVRMMDGFATQAAMAIEYTRTQRELQRVVLLDERERIAKELHDGIIQSLFAVGMGLQAITSGADPAEIEHRIEGAVGDLDQVIGDLRNYIFALRPGILADHRLDGALRHLTAEFEARCRVPTSVQIDGQVAARLANRALDLVQLTREALSNVGRHARASSCRIRLSTFRGRAVLTIEDDGDGFEPLAAHDRGQGLRNMEERVARLGGRMTIRSVPHQGTRLRMTLPLD
ncbi:MAG TPA: GAF domain-containing sensor histidine kinase [Candidatus Micrarchaeaceae archaeon]|nr:GAF domain-containing sensor histidine kinase [Candidatus Micrarchaeaceae archaeon]